MNVHCRFVRMTSVHVSCTCITNHPAAMCGTLQLTSLHLSQCTKMYSLNSLANSGPSVPVQWAFFSLNTVCKLSSLGSFLQPVYNKSYINSVTEEEEELNAVVPWNICCCIHAQEHGLYPSFLLQIQSFGVVQSFIHTCTHTCIRCIMKAPNINICGNAYAYHVLISSMHVLGSLHLIPSWELTPSLTVLVFSGPKHLSSCADLMNLWAIRWGLAILLLLFTPVEEAGLP